MVHKEAGHKQRNAICRVGDVQLRATVLGRERSSKCALRHDFRTAGNNKMYVCTNSNAINWISTITENSW